MEVLYGLAHAYILGCTIAQHGEIVVDVEDSTLDFNQPCRSYLILNCNFDEIMGHDQTLFFINTLTNSIISILETHLQLCFRLEQLCDFNNETVQILEAHTKSGFYAQITVTDIAFQSASVWCYYASI